MKHCWIINERFSWILKVDGYNISFNGGYDADYFKQHYRNLGYKVHFICEPIDDGLCQSYERSAQKCYSCKAETHCYYGYGYKELALCKRCMNKKIKGV